MSWKQLETELEPQIHLWSIADYHQIIEVGIDDSETEPDVAVVRLNDNEYSLAVITTKPSSFNRRGHDRFSKQGSKYVQEYAVN